MSQKEFGTWDGRYNSTPLKVQLAPDICKFASLLSPDISKGSTRVCSRLWRESQLCLAHLLRCSIILNNALHFEFSVSLFDFAFHSPAVLSPSPLLLEPPAHFFALLPPPVVNMYSIKCSKRLLGASNVCFHKYIIRINQKKTCS